MQEPRNLHANPNASGKVPPAIVSGSLYYYSVYSMNRLVRGLEHKCVGESASAWASGWTARNSDQDPRHAQRLIGGKIIMTLIGRVETMKSVPRM